MANFHVKNLTKPTPPLLKRISNTLLKLGATLTTFSVGTYVIVEDEKIKNLAYIVTVVSVSSTALGTIILNMFVADENDTPTT